MPKTSEAVAVSAAKAFPLCVDLDGTLLATNVLWESVAALVRHKPSLLFMLPFWLLRGRAYLKRRLATEVSLDPTLLPYRPEVLDFVIEARRAGTDIVLATGSDRLAVDPIVKHLGIFSDVVSSDGTTNLTGQAKCEVLQKRFGSRQFDYIGDSKADIAIWRVSRRAILVEPSRKTLKTAQRVSDVFAVFPRKRKPARALLRALRYHQWIKNILVFVPLLTAHRLLELTPLLQAICMFFSFSLCASSAYVLNDLVDLAADRRHPRKKFRPLAAGSLPVSTGLVLVPTLLFLAITIAVLTLPPLATVAVAGYFIGTVFYSFLLKRRIAADIIGLAGLYTSRILAGGIAVSVPVSTWLLAFSMFLFLSLAFLKRAAELQTLETSGHTVLPGRIYGTVDKEWIRSMGSSSGYLAVLVMALYINSAEVARLYTHPDALWLICPPMLYWITRIWFLACRGSIDDDPITFTMKDRTSYAVAAVIVLVMVAAL